MHQTVSYKVSYLREQKRNTSTMPESDVLMAVTIALISVDSCFIRLNVIITERGTPV